MFDFNEEDIERILPEGSISLSLDAEIEDTGDVLAEGSIINIPPAEQRKNFQTRVSGNLAIGLWILLGGVVIVHLLSVVIFSSQLVSKSDSDETGDLIERTEKSVAMVGDAAKTLYAILTPLITAVTGYYFAAKSNAESSNDVNPE